ncbi:hypothetical protein [Streptomyces clavifer]|uniref:hypothetical protein n=1 Tax=Streptomyces clavifer TaxID=68188 RepID=UPI00364BB92D
MIIHLSNLLDDATVTENVVLTVRLAGTAGDETGIRAGGADFTVRLPTQSRERTIP